MRVLFYSDYFCYHTTTFIYNDVVAAAREHTVMYLCTERINEAKFPFPDVRVVPYRDPVIVRKVRWHLEIKGIRLSFRNRRFSEGVHAAIEAFRPDIIQCNFAYEALRLTDNFTGHAIPIVINFLGHDASFHLKRPSYVRKLKALSQRKNIYITCNTHFLKKMLEDSAVFFKNNRIIYSGVDTGFFTRIPDIRDPGIFTFLQVAALARRKGQEQAIRAFARLLELVPGLKARLVLAGGEFEKGLRARIEALVKEFKLSEHVCFIDWISPAEERQLMQEADCFIHHSITVDGHTEGIPTVISEAMSMELPVISTRHAGIPEMVEEGVNGFLVGENDIEAFALRMRDMLLWKPLRANRAKAVQKFDIRSRARLFSDYYAEILDNKESR